MLSSADIAQLAELRDICIEVGQHLGKGRSETTYQRAIVVELQKRFIPYLTEETMTIKYKDSYVGFERLDIATIGEVKVIIELKTVAQIKTDHHWQVLHYMKGKDYPYGMVVNYSPTTIMINIVVNDAVPYLFDLATNELTPVESISY